MNLAPPIALEEAQRRLLAMAEPLGPETVPVEQAMGRYFAEPLVARRTQPSADLSAMDGYAMRADDRTGPWRVIGESAAGHPFAGELAVGEAVRISTGAMMPVGGGAVLLQEQAVREGDRLALGESGEASARHIRRKGFDFTIDQHLLPAGSRIGAGQLALAIAAGRSELPVGRQPSVAVLDSGDELCANPADCAAHQIPASNGVMLAALCAPLARSVSRLGPVPDTMEAMLAALAHADGYDVLVTSGGASVGDHDLVRPALEQWGANIDFWRVAIRPGKPLLVARRGRQLVVGLPGNPVSSYVTAFLFLLPLLRRLGGSSDAPPETMAVELGASLPAGGSRLEFIRAVLAEGVVRPLAVQDSSALRSLALANALIRREVGAPAAESGSRVMVHLLENGGIA